MPNTPEKELSIKWAAENPTAAYDDYENRLGNPLCWTKRLNIVAGNDFYTDKRPNAVSVATI
ncbi:MAG TPA: hypothetical protein VNQ55_03290 [Parapedobacter sp.]|nr:hypothetical protein [Parapedobacter sp.]